MRALRRILGALLSVLGLILVPLLITLYVRYGGGGDFPDRTGAPQLRAAVLEAVAQLPSPPGNIAVSSGGRVFVSLHPEARPKFKVVELVDGRMRPWPSEAFQGGGAEPRAFREVLSLRIDRQQRLWTLDTGMHGIHPGRLLAFDLKSGAVVHEYEFPRAVAGLGSHLNDFQVSPDGRFIYIAEASFFAKTPALVVYDVANKSARRLLERHPSVTAEHYTPVVQDRRMVALGLVAIRPGVDSIALDHRGEWLYFAPVTNLHMYRVRTADLRNEQLSAADLAGKVETFAEKTMSDGVTIDADGTLYLTDPEHSAIVLLRQDKSLQTLVKDNILRWPDGFSWGPDGWLYVTCSSLHQIIGRPPWTFDDHAPYQVYRFKPGGRGIPGH
ncbi:MAG: L-dopachrome tautomerase-related protein [Nevskiaceae bacterium]